MASEGPKIVVPAKVAAVLLLLAICPRWSYSYYDVLRIIVCGAAAYIAWYAKQQKSERLLWIMVVIAIVYNPFAPIYLDRGFWSILNLAAACAFWLAGTNPKRLL